MWPRLKILLSVMALGAIAGGMLQWQILRMEGAEEQVLTAGTTMHAGQHSGSVIIGKTDDGWYAPLLRRAAERQIIRRQQPCVTGVCQDV